MARLECHFSAPLARTQLEDYVREVRIDVLELSDDLLEEHLIGRIALNQILWSTAELDGESLFDACDSDSQGLYEVYRILTDKAGQFRHDLAIDEPVADVLFIYSYVLHPEFAKYRCGILESSLMLFGCESLVVMWMDEGELNQAELASLGFRRIAGEDLIYRHSALRTSFSDEFPRGQPVEAAATPEHQTWVLGQLGVKSDDQ